jgi:hypothetical protein
MLTQFFKGLSEDQQIDFMEQLVLADSHAINELIVYAKNKKDYYHPELKIKVGEYIHIDENFSWSGSSELQYYIDKKAVRDGYILVKVLKIQLLNTSRFVAVLKTKTGFETKDILTSYVKKLDLY